MSDGVEREIDAMFHHPWTRKEIALLTAIVTIAGIAAVLLTGLAYPEPVSHAALGPEWQCSRFALVFTACSRIQPAETAAIRVRKDPACPRPRT